MNRTSVPTRLLAFVLAPLLFFAWPQRAGAYSVLAHEALIDAAWNVSLRPLLLQRFPQATPDELKQAHAYAYGGAIIQDLGYYPHGSHFFSDLTHYVRSGDFILALLRDSRDLNGYAFALGALSHYAADNDGHRMGTNPAVPILYPKLAKKYGHYITYEQNPLAHVKTEFGFDVLEVAKQRYAPDSYHDFIGFSVDARLLEQAFQETYGLDLKVALPDEQKALGSYRRAVSNLIPRATRIGWTLKKDEIKRDQPSITKRKFLYTLKRASYEREWGKEYLPPTPWERFLAFLYKILPKLGPLKVLQLRTPTPQTEHMFEMSFNEAFDQYQLLIQQARAGVPDLPNDNFDTGTKTPAGEYSMNDDVHAKLLEELAKQNFVGITPEIRAELLDFYANPNGPNGTKRKAKQWAKVLAAVQQLKNSSAPSVADTVAHTEASPIAP